MRAIFAGLFVCGSTLTVVGLIGANFPESDWPWWVTPLIVLTFFTASFLALILFNRRGVGPQFSGKTLAEQIADLENAGMIQRDKFFATRAFELEEFEDEGRHYYVELNDGRVLYLNGQYLDEYEPIEDDPEFHQERRFPCTEFETIRHRAEGFILAIDCRGEVLSPELMAPYFSKADFKSGTIPGDGQILTEPYDEIKKQRTKG